MSDANIQVVQEIYERFRAGDGDGFLARLSDDVCFDHRGPEGPTFNKVYEGKAAVGEFLGDLAAAEEALVMEDRECHGGHCPRWSGYALAGPIRHESRS